MLFAYRIPSHNIMLATSVVWVLVALTPSKHCIIITILFKDQSKLNYVLREGATTCM